MKNKQLKHGIYLSYISLFVTNITNLILTPFIIKNLGQAEYGVYMLIGSFVGYLAIMDFGLGNATTKFVAEYRTKKDKNRESNFLYNTFILYILMSFIVFLIGSIIYMNLDNLFNQSLTETQINMAKIMFIFVVLNLTFTLPMNLFRGVINAYERFVYLRTLNISKVIIRATVIILLLSLDYNAVMIVLIDTIINILLMAAFMIYVYFKLGIKIRIQKFDLKLIKTILNYSSLIFVSVIVDQIYWRIGHLILGIMASAVDVAIFAVGMLIGQYFITFATAISGVFLPRITSMVVSKSSGEELTDILIKTGRIQFIVLSIIYAGFILFGRKFMILWAGPEYTVSWTIALIVLTPLLLVLTQTIGISILQAKNMHGFRAIAYLIIAVLNLFLSIVFVNIYGVIGPAIGTLISLVLGNIIVMNIYYHFKVGLNMVRFYKELLSGLLISFILSVLIGLSMNVIFPKISWTILIAQCIIFSIIYMLITWKFGMNKYEKTFFMKEIKQFKKLL